MKSFDPDVLKYTDYRKYLVRALQLLKREDRSFTKQGFAEYLGFSDRGHVYQILWGKRKIRTEMQEKKGKSVAAPGHNEPDTAFRRKCRMTWAALIKCVYEVDPLKCPKCGGQMKIISFIEEDMVIEKILRHCGLWKEQAPRPPPEEKPPPKVEESTLDYGFFERAVC